MKTHRHPPTLLGVLLFASVTGAAELHVPRDHGTIQGAIDAAADGDEVVVAQGRYLENHLGTHGKKITIRSTAPTDRAVVDATVIDGGETGSCFKFFESGEDATTVISGLTLTGASNQPGAYIYRSSPTFSHCVFRDFESNHEAAIKPAESSSRFIDCVFQDNHVTGKGGAGWLSNSTVTFLRCSFLRNGAGSPGGALYLTSGETTFLDCLFEDNYGPSTVEVYYDHALATFKNVRFINNEGGVRADSGSDTSAHIILEGCTMIQDEVGGRPGHMVSVDRHALAELRDCTFQGHGSDGNYVLNVSRYCELVVERCTLSGDQLGGGIRVSNGGWLTLVDSKITGQQDGVTLNSNDNVEHRISGSEITGNHPYGLSIYGHDQRLTLDGSTLGGNWAGGLISTQYGGGPIDVTITGSTLAHNGLANVRAFGQSSIEIANSIVWGGGRAIVPGDENVNVDVRYSSIEGGWAGEGNLDTDPRFCDVSCGPNELTLAAGSPCLGAGDLGQDLGSQGVGCLDPVVHEPVTLEVPGDYATLGGAMTAACSGDTVVIAPGTYTEGGVSWVLTDLALRSSDPDDPKVVAATVLDGNHTQRILDLYGAHGSISGLTLRNGRSSDGGAALSLLGGDMRVHNCRFENNAATEFGHGGGVALMGLATVSMEGSTFTGNSTESGYGGGLISAGAEVALADCDFFENTSTYGGGAYVEAWNSNLTTTIEGCRFEGNWSHAGEWGDYGGGGLAAFALDTTVRDCVFLDNAGVTGGGVHSWTSDMKFENCLFGYNLATETSGGAVASAYGSSVGLVNCTLYGNESLAGGAGVDADTLDSTADLTNTLLWSDGGASPALAGDITARYSLVEGGWAGEGNIDADPLLVDPLMDDFHLTADSPCVDAGTADGAPEVDFDGDARPQGTAVDIGFDEYMEAVPCDLAVAVVDYPSTIDRGETLAFRATAANECEEPHALDAAVLEIRGPASLDKPLYGGKAISLDPGAQVGAPVSLDVPSGAPTGIYTLTVVIYLAGEVIDSDAFDLEVR